MMAAPKSSMSRACIKVVIQAAASASGSRSSNRRPSHTTGNTRITAPTMTPRLVALENG